MKKSILIICAVLATFGITAFGFVNWNNSSTNAREIACVKTTISNVEFVNNLIGNTTPDLVYDVEPRFLARISKEDLHNAKSIVDILPEEATERFVSYKQVKVSVIHPEKRTAAASDSEMLNEAQLKLLQSTDYSSNIWITSNCRNKQAIANDLEGYDLVYYLSVIPEKEAKFKEGHDALIAYLKESSKEKTAIISREQLRPGRVIFTVTKEGTIKNVHLDSTCGYASVDETLVESIAGMSGKWESATNSKGKKVDQELVFFFGLKGC